MFYFFLDTFYAFCNTLLSCIHSQVLKLKQKDKTFDTAPYILGIYNGVYPKAWY